MTPFEIHGIEYGNCNCAYGCPCQFNALPTQGDCQYLLFARVDSGFHGERLSTVPSSPCSEGFLARCMRAMEPSNW